MGVRRRLSGASKSNKVKVSRARWTGAAGHRIFESEPEATSTTIPIDVCTSVKQFWKTMRSFGGAKLSKSLQTYEHLYSRKTANKIDVTSDKPLVENYGDNFIITLDPK